MSRRAAEELGRRDASREQTKSPSTFLLSSCTRRRPLPLLGWTRTASRSGWERASWLVAEDSQENTLEQAFLLPSLLRVFFTSSAGPTADASNYLLPLFLTVQAAGSFQVSQARSNRLLRPSPRPKL